MFKRIQKKQQKSELEEELGLDEDVKQALGFGNADTDTDESESESESESDGASSSGAAGLDERDVGSEDDSDADADAEMLDSNDDGAGDDFDGDSPLTLEEALRDPIYSLQNGDQVGCIVCPHKKLKIGEMQQRHLASSSHVRRFKKFCDLAQKPKYSSQDPRIIVSILNDAATEAKAAHEGGMSRREAKRRKKLEMIKKKRETTKKIIERKKKQKDATARASTASSSKENHPTSFAVSVTPVKSTKTQNKKASAVVSKAKTSSSDSARSKPGKSRTRKGAEDAQGMSSLSEVPSEEPKAKSKKRKAEPEYGLLDTEKGMSVLSTKPDTQTAATSKSKGKTKTKTKKEAGLSAELDSVQPPPTKKRKSESGNPPKPDLGTQKSSKSVSKSKHSSFKKPGQGPSLKHTSKRPLGPKATKPVLRYFDNASKSNVKADLKTARKQDNAKDLVIFD